jgi:hypothetical protein
MFAQAHFRPLPPQNGECLEEPTMTSAIRSAIRQIPGDYIMAALDKLPPCGPGATDQQVEIDVGQLGRFWVTFQPRKQARRGWPTSWIWIVTDAERHADDP